MNQKRTKKLRKIVKTLQLSKETLYRVFRASTLKPQFIVDQSCERGVYRSMKKALNNE